MYLLYSIRRQSNSAAPDEYVWILCPASRHRQLPVLRPLFENITSSTENEKYIQDRTTCNMYRKFRWVWTCGFEIYPSVGLLTDKHTDTLIAILRTPPSSVVGLCRLLGLRNIQNETHTHLLGACIARRREQQSQTGQFIIIKIIADGPARLAASRASRRLHTEVDAQCNKQHG